jgi:hypothetical protein
VALDLLLVGSKIVFGSSQREVLHGGGIVVAPLYLGLSGSCVWIVIHFVRALRERRVPPEWKKALVLGILMIPPLVL